MTEWESTGRAVSQVCSARWRKFRVELAHLSEQLRDAVIDIIRRCLSEASAETLHCVLQPRVPRRDFDSRAHERESWDDDDEWSPTVVQAPVRKPVVNTGGVVFRTVAWWLLSRGAMLPALAVGLTAGGIAWLGGTETAHGVRQLFELLLLFRHRLMI